MHFLVFNVCNKALLVLQEDICAQNQFTILPELDHSIPQHSMMIIKCYSLSLQCWHWQNRDLHCDKHDHQHHQGTR
jgi:hypothetical protein